MTHATYLFAVKFKIILFLSRQKQIKFFYFAIEKLRVYLNIIFGVPPLVL